MIGLFYYVHYLFSGAQLNEFHGCQFFNPLMNMMKTVQIIDLRYFLEKNVFDGTCVHLNRILIIP